MSGRESAVALLRRTGTDDDNHARSRVAAYTACLLLVSLAVFAPAAAGMPSEGDESCDAPVSVRETAHERLNSMRQVDDDALVGVPEETIDAAARQVSDGDTSYDLGEYCSARDAYRAAVEQATPALREAYRTGAARSLNASRRMVEAERADGNPAPETGALAVKIDQQSRELANASSLAALETRYERATALQRETRQRLPTRPAGLVAEALTEQPVVTAVAAVATLLAAVFARLLWATRTDSSTTAHLTR
ncbi:hypothetical protein HZS55_04530 [Halosimplex rubrum]|uniref:Uncharacterized protein n=1 Tax=Halosimplex rubrum TaxID=869889 RepID=A0A7D5T575_9EURY|nr:hypothetical protein [Halosimplex rubrum]QLH76615.1 hypothetical protein HZS55_04530 [Halosimplex rubrum]